MKALTSIVVASVSTLEVKARDIQVFLLGEALPVTGVVISEIFVILSD